MHEGREDVEVAGFVLGISGVVAVLKEEGITGFIAGMGEETTVFNGVDLEGLAPLAQE